MEVAHAKGYNTLYAHLSRVEVTKGQQLAAGDAVGLLGSTGRSTGPHLHYEVQRRGERLDPGVVKGDVHAVDLLLLGRLEGNVHAQRLHLQASAQIHGNLEAETLQVYPGARYQGSVIMRDAGAAPAVLPFSPSAPAADKAASTPTKA